MIGRLLTRILAALGLCRSLAWFEARTTLEDLQIEPIPENAKLKVSEQSYTIEAPIEEVFDAYLTAGPGELWPRDWVSFHFLLPPGSTTRVGLEAYPPRIQVGARVFVDLQCKPLQRWLKLMVGVEVTRIETNSELRYEYLHGSVTMGFNAIYFSAGADNAGHPSTQIRHRSEYLGTSPLLRLVMPLFQRPLHVGFVDALHGGMKANIERA